MKEDSKASVINHCIKCEAKFTSPEKPLKLLPCLHSMCLDCLHGRLPTPKIEKRRESSKDETNKAGSEEKNESEMDHVMPHTSESIEKENDSQDTNQVTSPDPNDKTEKKEDGADKDASISDQPVGEKEGESDKTEIKPQESDEPKSEEKTDEDKAKLKETFQAGDMGKDKQSEVDEAVEPDDVKPKPAKECPVCKDPIYQSTVPLMDNMFAALDTSQDISPGDDTSHTCTGCEEGQIANTYCEQCEEWLCTSCVDAHKRVRVTKDHTMSPKDQVKKSISKSPWEQQLMCKQHKQEQLKFFCEKCEALTCRDCQLVDHKDHKYQFLDQAAEQYKARLKGSLALMGEKRTKLSLSIDEIKQKLANCKEQKDSLQQEILEQADILVKGIKQAVWGVLSNLASFTDAATKRLNKEIDEFSDLMGKFDHCVHFMENILNDGSSMSLLYSKGSVEAKCRKVYHTQVDPHSLKGNLLIQYKHDVSWLLGNLSKIGSIFVNGVRYPPEKNGGQNARHGNANSYSEPRGGGMGATSPHLQHMANQVPGQQRVGGEWTKFIQTVSKPPNQAVAPPNMTMNSMASGNSLPPQLTLPSYRRPQNSGISQSCLGAPPKPASIPAHLSGSQYMSLVPPQYMPQGSRPGYTSMRLHHRPAHSSFPNQSDRQNNHDMRSPPQYRMGGEASGTSRSSHGTPDPARPASAGMYDGSGRPDSGGGGVAMVDIKKERRDQSPDCVITSSSLRSEKQSHFQTGPSNNKISETILEMQKSLDDVIRNVPMDLSDNLEQISGLKPPSEDTVNRHRPSPPPLTRTQTSSEGAPKSPTDQELRENWQGGNSMPGFSLPSSDLGDPNDDYCACCHNGGDVLCCDKCPRVFHLQCHIPEIPTVPSGSFVCTICEGDKPIEDEEVNVAGKVKTVLTDAEIKVCERILLDLYCHPSSLPFQEPVNKEQVPNYYKIITHPVDFNQIKCKLKRKHTNFYQTIKSFLFDLRQVFINCAIYNKVGSEVGKAGRMVRENFESLVAKLIPQYLDFVKENPSPIFSAMQQRSDPELSDANEETRRAAKRGSEHMGASQQEEILPKCLKADGALAT